MKTKDLSLAYLSSLIRCQYFLRIHAGVILSSGVSSSVKHNRSSDLFTTVFHELQINKKISVCKSDPCVIRRRKKKRSQRLEQVVRSAVGVVV